MIEDADLLRLLEDELADAEQYIDVLTGAERAKALDYYLRRPMGDEREGRSSVISGEVYKVVEGVATAITNIFVAAKDPVEFVPRRAEDVAAAEQRTAAVNYVFMTQNGGFLAMLESIKDGVQSKTGFLTWRWEKARRMTQERYRDQTPQSLALLMNDNAAVTIVEQQAKPGPVDEQGQVTMLYDVTVNVLNEKGSCVVESVPPEEVLVSSRARSADLQKAPVIIWRTYKTRTELLKIGYDEEMIDTLTFTQGRASNDESQVLRNADESDNSNSGEARIYTAWMEHDCDGDGVVELRRIVWSDQTILENEMTDHINMSAWTPNVQPHEFIGRCPADDAVESQEIMTVIKRQTLDNLYLANNPMWRVDTSDTRVNIEDFYNPEIGRPLRAPKDAAEAMIFPFIAQHSFPMLEYEQADQENKTGFTRYAQGLDAKSLNQTARGISIISNMSQQRVQLMARIYGELCLKPCMRGIAKLLSQYGDKELVFRLNGKYVTVDPREWQEEFDMSVTVGLGATDRDQQLLHLTTMAQSQAQAVQGGLMGKLVTPKNLYNVQAKIAENAGFRDPSFAWTDPDSVQEAPKPPPVDPEVIKQQGETQRAQMQAEAETMRMQMQLEAQERIEQMKLQGEMQLKERMALMDAELEKYKADLRAQTEREIGAMRAQAQAHAAMHKAAQMPRGEPMEHTQ